MTPTPRFPGVYVATTTPFREDGTVDFDAFCHHCDLLCAEGVTGLVPVGSCGEYEALTEDERAGVVSRAIDAAAGRVTVIPGVSGKSASEARRWAEQAAEAGCAAVMCLPPTSHAPTGDEVVAHFGVVAEVGLPVIAYNNPFSTRVDLTPELCRRLGEVDGVVAIKEFSQDVRRVAAIRQAAPSLEVICGCDDTVVEAALMGATGWIAGFANAFARKSVELFALCQAGRWAEATEAYLRFLPLLRYDADVRFVQAIKLAEDEVGLPGGSVRLPRLALSKEDADEVRAAVHHFLGEA